MKTYGSELRRLRIGERYSLTAVARELGVSTAYLSEVELGRKSPMSDRKTMDALMFLGCEDEMLHMQALSLKERGALKVQLPKLSSRNLKTLATLSDLIEHNMMDTQEWNELEAFVEKCF